MRVAVAVGVAVVVQALPLAAPLLLSKDVYAYWADARVITVHHASPYDSTPAAYADDPALPFVSEQWRATRPPYGPVWEALGTAPAAAAGSSAKRAELGYRVLALAGVLAAVALLARWGRSAGAVAFLGWNPLVALHFAGGGHNDAWMAALLVLAVCARGRPGAGAAWPLAAAFKAVPLVLVPLELARTRLRQPRAFWIALVATSAVIAVAGTAVFGTGWVTGPFDAFHQASPLGLVHWLTDIGLRHRYAVAIAGLAFAAIYAALLGTAWRTGRARLSLATTALCLCSALRPWYALWPVALASAEEDGPAAVAAYALSAYLLIGDALPL